MLMMKRSDATTSVKRAPPPKSFTSCQSRYLVLRLHPYLGDLRFCKSNIHHILHSTYSLMMKRTIDDPRRVGHAGADIELFCIKSVETSRNSGAPMSGCAEVLVIDICHKIYSTYILMMERCTMVSRRVGCPPGRASSPSGFISSQSRNLKIRLHPFSVT